VLLAINLLVIFALFGLRRLYVGVEWLMKALVLLMAVAFIVNLVYAGPSISEMFKGLIPQLPQAMRNTWWPSRGASGIDDPLLAVQGLIVTTFSIAGAFYQSYLVREKGWTEKDLGKGLFDSLLGIAILAGLTSVVLMTSATVLHGRVDANTLGSAADVARQLQPMFGSWAMYLFSAGILAGAFSSFLVNAMIGGAMMSDGLGLGSRMTDPWPKVFTTLALLAGCGVAMWVTSGESAVHVIIFAQAMTVLGAPMLAFVLLYLALAPGRGRPSVPWVFRFVAMASVTVSVALAMRIGYTIYLKVWPGFLVWLYKIMERIDPGGSG
jgi:Mn2+/Fe2+ NRAMP family transporter